MVEYQLVDFQRWLEADPSRTQGLTDWAAMLAQPEAEQLFARYPLRIIQPFLRAKFSHHPDAFTFPEIRAYVTNYRQVLEQWIKEVEQAAEQPERTPDQIWIS